MMTREEILMNSIWVEGKLPLKSPFFDQIVTVNLLTSDKTLRYTTSILSDKMVQKVNDFIQLPATARPLMAKLLHQHCLDCCEAISYGIEVLEGETETAANLRAFGVTDAASALAVANLHHAVIEEENFRTHRFVRLVFYPPWEEEHGCELVLRNGELLDYYGEADAYLAPLDIDE